MTQLDMNTVKAVLHEIATQAHNLAMGLQNAAPPQDATGAIGPPKSVQYLLETAVQLEKTSRAVDAIAHDSLPKSP